MTILTAVIACWLFCGFLAYGLYKNSLKNFYLRQSWVGYRSDQEVLAYIYAFGGPFGLFRVVSFLKRNEEKEIGICFVMPRHLTKKHRTSRDFLAGKG